MTFRIRRRLAGVGAFLALTALALFMSAPSRADVTAEGDVSPTVTIGIGGVQTTIPDLPEDGGDVGDVVIVGGTGIDFVPREIPPIGRVIVDNPGFTLPLESERLYIAGEPGQLPGSVGGGSGTVQISGDSVGLVQVSGFFSQWAVEELAVIGSFGQAYLEITGGGQVTVGDVNVSGNGLEDSFVGSNLNSNGYMQVSGFGSRFNSNFLSVGFQGTGRVDVTARGTLISRSGAILGDDYGFEIGPIPTSDRQLLYGQGHVYVDGIGSRWNVGNFTQGGLGTDGDLIIGREGRGVVEVRNGGVVRVQVDTEVAKGSGSALKNPYGEITVNGRGSSFWTLRNLLVAEDPTSVAEIHVENEGILRVDGTATLFRNSVVDLATGGILQVNNEITGSGTPLTNFGVIRGDGRVETRPDDLPMVNNGDIRNAAGVANLRERLFFTGPVINNDNIESVGGEINFEAPVTNATPDSEIIGIDAILRFRGGLINNGGRLLLENTLVEAVGVAPPPIVSNTEMDVLASDKASTIVGNLTLGGGNVYAMELGALNFSKLNVSGTATLGGVLDISGVSGYLPRAGDRFEIMTANAINGTFDPVVVDHISGFDFTVTYDNFSVILNAIGGAFVFEADFNNDGVVDFGDYLAWQGNYGATGVVTPGTMGDADGDGDVDDDDFAVWQDQVGGPPPAVPAFAAVPEPAAAVLALAALALPAFRRRR